MLRSPLPAQHSPKNRFNAIKKKRQYNRRLTTVAALDASASPSRGGIWASGSNLSFSCPSDALPCGTTSREKEREPNTANQVESESESESEYESS